MYEKLNKYVRDDVPIVNVCLLSGQPGIGKSTILANWYEFGLSKAYLDSLLSQDKAMDGEW